MRKKKKSKFIKSKYIITVILIVFVLFVIATNFSPSVIQSRFTNTSAIENPYIVPENFKLIDAKTLTIEEGGYKIYSISLDENKRIHIYMINNETGTVNTILLNSAGYADYQGFDATPSYKSIQYFIDGSFWGVRSADFEFESPKTDTYIFLVSKSPLIAEQEQFSGISTVDLLVYEVKQ